MFREKLRQKDEDDIVRADAENGLVEFRLCAHESHADGLTCLRALHAARHDIRQLRRRSDWSEKLWQFFLKGYEETFGADYKKI